MPSWLPALPCESAIAYWAIFICSLPPRCYFPCVLRERGIKPQPIYGSFPSWSNRMIQKHSHMHRRAHKHTSVHMLPKKKKKTHTRRNSRTERKMHVWTKTPVWSNNRHMHRRTVPVTCQLPKDWCLHWEDIKVPWCVLGWHRAVESGAVLSGKHTVYHIWANKIWNCLHYAIKRTERAASEKEISVEVSSQTNDSSSALLKHFELL